MVIDIGGTREEYFDSQLSRGTEEDHVQPQLGAGLLLEI